MIETYSYEIEIEQNPLWPDEDVLFKSIERVISKHEIYAASKRESFIRSEIQNLIDIHNQKILPTVLEDGEKICVRPFKMGAGASHFWIAPTNSNNIFSRVILITFINAYL